MKRSDYTVGISALLADPKGGGVNTYIRNLSAHLFRAKTLLKFALFCNPEGSPLQLEEGDCIDFPLSGSHPAWRLLQEWSRWPALLKKNAIDLFHSPISYIPPGVRIPSVFTVHDLRAFHYPETFEKMRLRFLQKRIPASVERAHRIIAVSEYTRRDVLGLFSVPDEKVITIHEGIDLSVFAKPAVDREHILQKYELPNRFLFSVGHLEPRKNFSRLFRALAILKQRYRITMPLVVCGRKNWKYESLFKEIDRLRLGHQLRLLGSVSDKDLRALYQAAFIFIYPSLFEGFGFPPLESMAAGVPVIVSNATSLPEVCGKAALYADPYDEEDLAARMRELIEDSTRYDKLRQAGLRQVKKFSWTTCAHKTIQVYKETLNEIYGS